MEVHRKSAKNDGEYDEDREEEKRSEWDTSESKGCHMLATTGSHTKEVNIPVEVKHEKKAEWKKKRRGDSEEETAVWQRRKRELK